MRVSGLFLYPVKAMRGTAVPEAAVEPYGLAGVRRWMVVDAHGRFLTQRQLPALARFAASLTRGGGLDLAIGTARLGVAAPGPGSERLPVSIWRSHLEASCAGPEASAFLSRHLGQTCRLVFLDDSGTRPIEPAYAQPGEHVSFADGFPLLLASEASLASLNRALAVPVGMERFRANLVIENAPAWAEQCWRRLRIGGVPFRGPKPCTRCIVTTIDQDRGEIAEPGEPLATLARLSRGDTGVVFGLNLVPLAPGRLRVGDAVELLE